MCDCPLAGRAPTMERIAASVFPEAAAASSSSQPPASAPEQEEGEDTETGTETLVGEDEEDEE